MTCSMSWSKIINAFLPNVIPNIKYQEKKVELKIMGKQDSLFLTLYPFCKLTKLMHMAQWGEIKFETDH